MTELKDIHFEIIDRNKSKHLEQMKKKDKDRFDKLSYAEEELVAELGSAILSAMLGISKKPSDQHAKYLNNWIQAIKDKPKALFDAVAHSQKAISYIEDLQPKEEKQQPKIEKVA